MLLQAVPLGLPRLCLLQLGKVFLPLVQLQNTTIAFSLGAEVQYLLPIFIYSKSYWKDKITQSL